MQKKYYREVNIARGIALFLVILGHSFPDGDTGMKFMSAMWIRGWLYTFHMAIFFTLSGFVSAERLVKGEYNIVEEVVKKVKRLIIPYLLYSIITLFPKLLLSAYVNNPFKLSEFGWLLLGKSPNGAMWFLWTLFVVSLIALILCRFCRRIMKEHKQIILLCIGIVLYIIRRFVSFGFENYVFKYFIFYAIGIVMNSNYERIKTYFRFTAGIAAIIITVVLACPMLALKGEYLITGLIGTYGFYVIAYYMDSGNYIGRQLFDKLGKLSYDIYLLSYFAQIPIRIISYSVLNLPYWLCVVSMFIGGILVPIPVAYFIRKTSFLKGILLGDFK